MHVAVTAGALPAPGGEEPRCTCRPGATVWLTGRPGPGKTALARAVRDELHRSGRRAEVLYGDEPQADRVLGTAPAPTAADGRQLGLAAETLARNGITVLALVDGPGADTAGPAVRARHRAAGVPYLAVEVGPAGGPGDRIDVAGQDPAAAAASLLRLMNGRGPR
ncbi:adenylyl-sulfate kinase [Kitasatospora sp. KL5]|uniref:adenylyl-sulfate kinase n=1 Tax=Kitasatospora sp. KL5 TaxID=3425125 RepID=UPI003D6DB25A